MTPFTVQHSETERLFWHELREQSPQLQELEAAGASAYRHWPSLLTDVFASLFKYSVDRTPDAKLDGTASLSKALMDRGLEDPLYGELRAVTLGDDFASAFGTLTLGRALQQAIQADPDLKRLADEANEESEEGAEDADQAGPADAAAVPRELSNEERRAVRRALRKAADEASKSIDGAREAFRSWGTEPGELTSVPMGQRMALAEQLMRDPNLRRMADLLGRFRIMAQGARAQRVQHRTGEIVGIRVSDDVGRMLPTETVLLADPLLRGEWLRRYAEGTLLTYDERGTARQGKGPVIALCDTSGSTRGDIAIWIKAVALALMGVARSEHRPFAAVIFSSADEVVEIGFDPTDSKATYLERAIKLATTQFMGGTDWEAPVQAALGIVKRDQRMRQADIVLLTDGDCAFPERFRPEWEHAHKSLGMRLVGALIGRAAHRNRVALEGWADQILAVEPLDDHAKIVFESVR